MTATARQIGLIHVLAGKAGLDDDLRRDFLEREAGVRSTKALDGAAAARVIDKLKGLSGAAGVPGAVAGLNSPAARKLRALWIAGYDLGLVRDRSDRAMLAFLERQCGVSHTRFLNEPGQATSAIEALKSWLKRDGKAGGDGIAAHKRAVIEAQWGKLIDAGAVSSLPSVNAALDFYAFRVAGRHGWSDFDLAHYDQVQKALGRKLRAVIAGSEVA